eukprot:COSAG02_NODE_62573_length_265_cov_0.939759_1_plen_40_part_10
MLVSAPPPPNDGGAGVNAEVSRAPPGVAVLAPEKVTSAST